MDEQLKRLEEKIDQQFASTNQRFDRIERMVEDLIRIVGNTNSMVSQTTKRVDQISNDIHRIDGQNALVEKRLDWQNAKIGQLDERTAIK